MAWTSTADANRLSNLYKEAQEIGEPWNSSVLPKLKKIEESDNVKGNINYVISSITKDVASAKREKEEHYQKIDRVTALRSEVEFLADELKTELADKVDKCLNNLNNGLKVPPEEINKLELVVFKQRKQAIFSPLLNKLYMLPPDQSEQLIKQVVNMINDPRVNILSEVERQVNLINCEISPIYNEILEGLNVTEEEAAKNRLVTYLNHISNDGLKLNTAEGEALADKAESYIAEVETYYDANGADEYLDDIKTKAIELRNKVDDLWEQRFNPKKSTSKNSRTASNPLQPGE